MSSFEHFQNDFNAVQSWIDSALTVRRHCLRQPTVITVAESGPKARTMVLRDVREGQLFFFTDRRSFKVSEIQAQPKGCVHAYDTKKRLQIQIYGTFSLVEESPHLVRWRSMGLQNFSDYGSQAPPGTSRPTNNIVTKELAKINFSVITLNPTSIELLKLQRDGHWRVVWNRAADRWTPTVLVP
ncbi:MAG: pyridoxamine 5'-phosphate oxidase family protein [Myxococcota bacterium]|nr:pyridoxamine 5'-phosphate oxidase family protein [Myxococcota bacterium]